jgi:HSP20 family molecular chaperone IbpA
MDTRGQPAPESFERFVRKSRTRYRKTAPARPAGLQIGPPDIQQDESLPISIAENQSEYSIVVPLAGIDPRKIHVLATPRSLVIEIHSKSTVWHALTRAPVTESIDRRISRELTLPIEIEQGATTVRVTHDSLHITARKSEHNQETSWSQLIHFDTRAPSDPP